MAVVLIAYEGGNYGFDDVISVATGSFERWVEVPGLSIILKDTDKRASEVLYKVVERLGYQVGRRWGSTPWYFVELPRARSPNRVYERLKKALEVGE